MRFSATSFARVPNLRLHPDGRRHPSRLSCPTAEHVFAQPDVVESTGWLVRSSDGGRLNAVMPRGQSANEAPPRTVEFGG